MLPREIKEYIESNEMGAESREDLYKWTLSYYPDIEEETQDRIWTYIYKHIDLPDSKDVAS